MGGGGGGGGGGVGGGGGGAGVAEVKIGMRVSPALSSSPVL